MIAVLFLLPAALSAIANDLEDSITRKPTLTPHETCGSAMACSVVAALVSCDCRVDAATNHVVAKTTLHLLGTIYYFQGPFGLIAKRARDRSVVDGTTAIAHEYRVHIDPAVASVVALMTHVESVWFGSLDDCALAGRELARTTPALFRDTLIATQREERDSTTRLAAVLPRPARRAHRAAE